MDEAQAAATIQAHARGRTTRQRARQRRDGAYVYTQSNALFMTKQMQLHEGDSDLSEQFDVELLLCWAPAARHGAPPKR